MIAITGAGGFVAGHLIALLLEDTPPAELRCVLRVPTALPAGVDVRVADVRDAASLRGAFDDCEAIVHTVAIPTERAQRFADVNVRGVENAVAEAARADVGRFVHMSVLGADPWSRYPYLRSRGRGERAISSSRLPHTIVRSSLLFGPGDDFFGRLRFSLRFPVVPLPNGGKARFQPLHVDDLAQVLRAALRGAGGGVHEVGGPEPVSYAQIVAETMRALGVRRLTVGVPAALLKPGAAMLGLALKDPPVTPGQLDLLGRDDLPERNDIERVFQVRPRPFRGGLGYLASSAK